MPSSLTKTQTRVLEFLQTEIRLTGRAPTIREIASHLGHRTTSSAQLHVTNLEKAGYVIRRGGHRSLQLVQQNHEADEVDSSFSNSEFEQSAESFDRTGLRLAGVVAAGQPIETVQQDEWIDLGNLYDDSHYVLRVQGDSMIEDHIADGDMVVIKRQTVCSDGDMVVARIDGEATLKRFYREQAKRRIRLEPANQAMKPIYRKNVEIDGVVVGVIRVMGG